MSISIGVHNGTTASGSATTLPQSPALATTTGRLIVCLITCNDAQTVASIADTAGNTYVSAGARSHTVSSGNVEIWYAKNITGNAANVVTVTYSASANTRRLCVLEIAGLDTTSPLDQAIGSATGTSTAPTTGSVTTTVADEILIGAVTEVGTFTAGSGFTISDAPVVSQALEYKIVSATGSYVADGTQSSSSAWAIALATFKAAAAGGALFRPSALDGLSQAGRQLNPSLS